MNTLKLTDITPSRLYSVHYEKRLYEVMLRRNVTICYLIIFETMSPDIKLISIETNMSIMRETSPFQKSNLKITT